MEEKEKTLATGIDKGLDLRLSAEMRADDKGRGALVIKAGREVPTDSKCSDDVAVTLIGRALSGVACIRTTLLEINRKCALDAAIIEL